MSSKKVNLEIKVPKDWSAVTLRKYLELLKDMEVYKDTPEAIDAALFHHLCNVPPNYLSKLDISIYTNIREDLYKLMNIDDSPLKKIITIDNIQFGFEPNLSEMEYGAYLDLQAQKEIKIDENWPKIMNILYRKVTNKIGGLYEIETYTAKDNVEKFLDITMDVHFGAMFFFLNTLTDLLKDTQKSLNLQLQESLPNIKSILGKSGLGTIQFTN